MLSAVQHLFLPRASRSVEDVSLKSRDVEHTAVSLWLSFSFIWLVTVLSLLFLRGDVLVPLGTAAIEPALPANPQLQLILQQARRSMIAGSGRIVMVRAGKSRVLVIRAAGSYS